MARLVPIEDALLDQVVNAVSALAADDAVMAEAMQDIEMLSASTMFEGVDASPDGIFALKDTERFEATATIYVTLQYGEGGDDVSIGEAYPATIEGRFENGALVIDRVRVDTSSFYE
jgi:hypothetical protein